MLPLTEMPVETAASIHTVLTDIDDTLTTDGRLPACAYGALEALSDEGIRLGVITGRPAGWCDMIARFWPVEGVVGENGGLLFAYDRRQRRMRRLYAAPESARSAAAAALRKIREQVLREIPGAAASADQAYRETDLAIDFREDVPALGDAEAERIRQIFLDCGAEAKVSSIHVNGWFGSHDKLSMTRRFAADILGTDLEGERPRILYCGDSPNDAPMFGFFPNACGVANVLRYRGSIEAEPAWVASREGGEGFAEIARRLLAARRQGQAPPPARTAPRPCRGSPAGTTAVKQPGGQT